jgi:adenylate cyclase
LSALWRGSWSTRIRIASGLVLFTFVLFHFINIGFGLISPDLMEQGQTLRQLITRSLPGEIILYAALFAHMGLSISKLAGRRTLKMPVGEAIQIALGLIIPLLLIAHVVQTRVANEIYDVDDEFGYISVLIWGTWAGFKQALLLLIVWVHGCLGLHFWLSSTRWWHRWWNVLVGTAVFIPGFALAGFLTEGRRVLALFQDEATRVPLMQQYNWPSQETFGVLIATTDYLLMGFWAILGLTTLVFVTRKLSAKRRSIHIRYVDGPEVTTGKGPTLLEVSRANGVPHTSLCGGRGRCTTCRVIIEDGADLLHPPNEAEARSLAAVNAPPNARLACQIQPTDSLTVFRVFKPDGRRGRAHASQGAERTLAIMFLDMRGFTARTTGQLPYDVVFLLNRFFDVVVPCITSAGGTIDKYLGDGLLAVFETENETTSAQAALKAAAGIGAAVQAFNLTLAAEGAPPVAIGMGLHLGDLVLGEIGAAGNAPRTLIGDTVNTTSRLEGKTKELGVELLVSEILLQTAGHETGGLDLVTPQMRGVTAPLSALAVKSGADLFEILQVRNRNPPTKE